MTPQLAIDLFRQALWTAFWLSLPLLAAGLLVGVIVSLVQVLTSLQDPAIGSVPRLAAFLAAAILAGPWMLAHWLAYTQTLLGDLGRYAR
jgi:flagellar biosynthetic protein FliQ